MSEDISQHRFEPLYKPTAESVQKLEELEVAFVELKDKYPYLSGFGVFGSRAKGTEIETSDYDVCFFYNSEKIKDWKDGIPSQWADVAETVEKVLGAKIDHRIQDPSGGLRIDISQHSTDNQIVMFVDAAKQLIVTQDRREDLLKAVSIPPVQDLYARFFKVWGNEVLLNRQYIVSKLMRVPHGDRYLDLLIEMLEKFHEGK